MLNRPRVGAELDGADRGGEANDGAGLEDIADGLLKLGRDGVGLSKLRVGAVDPRGWLGANEGTLERGGGL